jgi:hypothetical protein
MDAFVLVIPGIWLILGCPIAYFDRVDVMPRYLRAERTMSYTNIVALNTFICCFVTT